MSNVCVRLTRLSLGHNVFTSRTHTNLRPCATRMLSLTSQLHAKSSKPPDDEKVSKPIQYSTSKASHRTWKVEHSLGSQHQRPWWKVLPVSFIGIGFVAWCFLREETEVDRSLERDLFEHFPEEQSNEEQEEDSIQNKPS